MSEKKFIIPPADIYESKEKYHIVLDIPGTLKESIEITTEGDLLTVTGKVPEVSKDWKPISNELTLGEYKREFTIGNKVNRETIQAKYENGILKIDLEKSEQIKPRKIEVKIA